MRDFTHTTDIEAAPFYADDVECQFWMDEDDATLVSVPFGDLEIERHHMVRAIGLEAVLALESEAWEAYREQMKAGDLDDEREMEDAE